MDEKGGGQMPTNSYVSHFQQETKEFHMIKYATNNNGESGVGHFNKNHTDHEKMSPLQHKSQTKTVLSLWQNMFQLWKSWSLSANLQKISQRQETRQAEGKPKQALHSDDESWKGSD